MSWRPPLRWPSAFALAAPPCDPGIAEAVFPASHGSDQLTNVGRSCVLNVTSAPARLTFSVTVKCPVVEYQPEAHSWSRMLATALISLRA